MGARDNMFLSCFLSVGLTSCLVSGHIGIRVPDINEACKLFEELNVKFIKKPDSGECHLDHWTHVTLTCLFSWGSVTPPRLHVGGVSSSVKHVLGFVGETFYSETGQNKNKVTKQRTTSPWSSPAVTAQRVYVSLSQPAGSTPPSSEHLRQCSQMITSI